MNLGKDVGQTESTIDCNFTQLLSGKFNLQFRALQKNK